MRPSAPIKSYPYDVEPPAQIPSLWYAMLRSPKLPMGPTVPCQLPEAPGGSCNSDPRRSSSHGRARLSHAYESIRSYTRGLEYSGSSLGTSSAATLAPELYGPEAHKGSWRLPGAPTAQTQDDHRHKVARASRALMKQLDHTPEGWNVPGACRLEAEGGIWRG